MKQSIIPADCVNPSTEGVSVLTRLARQLLLGQLRKIRHGRLRFIDSGLDETFGSLSAAAPFDVTLRVRNPLFYSDAVFGGTVGAGEAYINGHWHCDDLTALVRLMVINRPLMNDVDSGWSRLSAPLLRLAHWMNRNHKAGSRRNISAHYDLGNRFFELFLDETMTYSCGIFERADSTLLCASIAKFDAACSKLDLRPGQHLLEIGTGWGGLAIHAARHYGCRVTTTTISREQYELACERVAQAGLQRQITVLLEDYRDLRGRYDALVSIEMIEAVGHQFFDTYFSCCSRLLEPHGAMLLQSITIQDQFYDQARRSVDFIKRFIFPGCCIPSVKALSDSLTRASDLKIFHLEDIGPHYATTLKRWRERFLARQDEVRALGYPESFIRMWEYYLCYCEGGFEERQLGDVQMLLTKPLSRRVPIASVHAAPPSLQVLDELKAAVGDGAWVDSAADLAAYVTDFRRLYHGATPLVLLPRDTAQVSAVLAICNRHEVAVVPHGGNTSYCGAATPDESGSQIVISLKRLKRVRRMDAANYSMVVEAGITLAEAQAAAQAADRLFPLSLGSEGTAQIGGNLSTNAGGTAVLRYGMMRDLVFGLEVVLADGRVLSALHGLRKDNTGYDVKSLFIGAEGTLGIITAASLKLFPLPADTATALVGIDSPQQALSLLARLRGAAGDQLTTFELLPRRAVELTVKYVQGVANPLSQDAPWYLLVELTSPNPRQNLATLLGDELQQAAAENLILDAMIATSIAQSLSMWKLRESVPEAQRHYGASLKHDISVPVSSIPELIERGGAIIRRLVPEGELVGYGHMGDGNLHFNVSQLPGADRTSFMEHAHELEHAIFDLVGSLGGSISAEHGIGRLKVDEFAERADPVELAVMGELKRALDPRGILNPGKVLAASRLPND